MYRVITTIFALFLMTATLVLAAPATIGGMETYRDDRHGFSIGYPSNIFRPQGSAVENSGRLFVSVDGNARLLVGAFPNDTSQSMRDYRQFILERSYGGAEIDYAPVRRNFFVLSGTLNGAVFYERVSFTCDGAIINSWAMVYPEAQKRFYDRVVEAVAKTYRPGSRQCP